MNNNQLPAKVKDWTLTHFGRAVGQALTAQARVDKLKAEEKLAKIDIEARFKLKQNDQKAILAPLMKSIKAAFKKLVGKGARRIVTEHGVARYRKMPSKLARNTDLTEQDVINRMVANPLLRDCFKTEYSPLLEVLETKPVSLIEAAGYHRTAPNDQFELVVKE